MEREEVKKLLMINIAIFPQFYNKVSDRELALQVNVWHDLFQNQETIRVEAAFRKALSTAQYPVKPADVFAILQAQDKANLPTTDELFEIAENAAEKISQYHSPERGWEQEWKATKTGYESALEIYNELPAILREWKHSPLDLLNWWRAIDNDNESYIRREFDQIIKRRLERREMLGIGFTDEFHPIFDGVTGWMKSLPEQQKKLNTGEKR